MKVAGETIESTPGHPFWVVQGEDLELRPMPEHVPVPPWQSQLPGRWVDAGDLRVGDVLYLKSGQLAPIEELTLRHVREMVYNFQVEELESYAVGTGAVLVHNNSGIHLNTNTAISQFGIYEINIKGELYKIGKADLNRITQSSGLPTRLPQQLRRLTDRCAKNLSFFVIFLILLRRKRT